MVADLLCRVSLCGHPALTGQLCSRAGGVGGRIDGLFATVDPPPDTATSDRAVAWRLVHYGLPEDPPATLLDVDIVQGTVRLHYRTDGFAGLAGLAGLAAASPDPAATVTVRYHDRSGECVGELRLRGNTDGSDDRSCEQVRKPQRLAADIPFAVVDRLLDPADLLPDRFRAGMADGIPGDAAAALADAAQAARTDNGAVRLRALRRAGGAAAAAAALYWYPPPDPAHAYLPAFRAAAGNLTRLADTIDRHRAQHRRSPHAAELSDLDRTAPGCDQHPDVPSAGMSAPSGSPSGLPAAPGQGPYPLHPHTH